MSTRLSDNLNSNYIGAATKLRAQGARRRIVAYVESFDDIFFWRNVLGRFEDKNIYFEVMLPSHTSLAKGKKVAITNILRGKLGQKMIACRCRLRLSHARGNGKLENCVQKPLRFPHFCLCH